MKAQWNKEERFGLAVDLLGAGMKGLVLYTVLLLTGFWGYQSGTGDFLPLLYGMIIPLTLVFAFIYYRWDGTKCVLGHVLALIPWMGLFWPARVNQWSFLAVGVLAAAESLIYKFVWGDNHQRRYRKRFKMQNYFKWGIMMWVISIILYSQSDLPSEEFPIAPAQCGSWMTAAFVIYLILVVMLKYLFQQYEYFRQHSGMDQNTFRRLKRMNGIVAVLVTVLIVFTMFCTAESFVLFFSKLMTLIYGTAIGGSFWLLTQMETSQYEGGAHVDLGSASDTVRNLKDNPPPSQGHMNILYGIFFVLLAAAVVYVLWKIYKSLGANYQIGEDEAAYIPKYEEKELIVGRVTEERTSFGNDNRGRIRKAYYRCMNACIDKKNLQAVTGKTPKELAGMYGRPMEGEQLRILTEYYEKARYSDEECMEQDVEKVKELAEM